MKKKIYILCAMFCLIAMHASADTENSADTTVLKRRISLGVQIGTDIGGAIPVPLSNIPDKFNPYPQLSISLGARITIPLKDRKWALGTEITYKKIGLDADARVENQKFEGTDQGVKKIQYYSGTAKMHMSFTMLEIPVYAKYAFTSGGSHRLVFGAFGAYYINNDFNVTATKGYVGNEPDQFENSVMPESPIHMDFGSSLGSWDAGVLVGYEKNMFSRLNLGIRVMMGFKDIFTNDNKYFDYKMLNMRGTITVSYNLIDLRTRSKK